MRVAFDIDGTLFKPEGGVRADVLALLRVHMNEEDTQVILWSGGGTDYVERRLPELGLSREWPGVTIIPKGAWKPHDIDICYDDQDVKLAKINIKV